MHLANTKINHIYFCVSLDLYYLVECVFAYRCLFPYLQHICSTLTQMVCLITVRISRRKGNVGGQSGDAIALRLKLLKRFKKFFLYRNRLLKIREDGGTSEEKESFIKRFLLDTDNAEAFFELFDEDIFQSEYRLLIQNLSKKEAEEFQSQIRNFEKQLMEGCNIETDGKTDWLFYAKDVKASFQMKTLAQDIYASLIRWPKENFSGLRSVNIEKEMETFRTFLGQRVSGKEFPTIYDMLKTGFEGRAFTKFVMKASAES